MKPSYPGKTSVTPPSEPFPIDLEKLKEVLSIAELYTVLATNTRFTLALEERVTALEARVKKLEEVLDKTQ